MDRLGLANSPNYFLGNIDRFSISIGNNIAPWSTPHTAKIGMHTLYLSSGLMVKNRLGSVWEHYYYVMKSVST